MSAVASLANALLGMQKNAEALEVAQDALGRARRGLGVGHPRMLSSMNNMGAALHALGRADEAKALL